MSITCPFSTMALIVTLVDIQSRLKGLTGPLGGATRAMAQRCGRVGDPPAAEIMLRVVGCSIGTPAAFLGMAQANPQLQRGDGVPVASSASEQNGTAPRRCSRPYLPRCTTRKKRGLHGTDRCLSVCV